MKKFLSMILAMAMLISLVPSVFADGTEGDAAQEYSGITVKYDFTKFEGAEVDASAKVDYSKTFGFWEFRTRGGKKATGGGTSSRNVVKSANGHLQVVARVNWDTDNQNAVTYANTDWVAFEITVPKAGLYDVTLNNVSYGLQGGTVGLWILPGSTNDNSIDGMLTEGTYLKSFDFMYDAKLGYVSFATEEVTLDDAYYFNADTYIFVYKVLEGHACAKKTTEIKSSDIGDMYLNGITLDGDGADEANYVPMISSLTATEIDGTTTVSAVAELMSDGEAATGVTYSYAVADDDDADKAEIINGNVVKGLANGTATIIATATASEAKGGLSSSKSIEVDVTVPAEEPEDEPEAAPTIVNYGVFVNEKACAAVVTANGVALDATTGSKTGSLTPGEALTATASDTDDYTFRYWVLGSAATGRYYSSEKSVTVNPYANIALTAIYTAKNDGAKVVDLFNYNGEFLKTLTDLSELANVKPTMIGYTFDSKWLLADETELTAQTELTAPVTQAVAKYTKKQGYEEEVTNNNSTYGWTRNGKLVTYDKNYTFLTWLNEVGEIVANTKEVTNKIPLAVLESNGNAYMLEYDKGAYEVVEAGILFGENAEPTVDSAYSKAKVKVIKAHGQFTASPMGTETNARGYVIYKDGSDYKVIYAD